MKMIEEEETATAVCPEWSPGQEHLRLLSLERLVNNSYFLAGCAAVVATDQPITSLSRHLRPTIFDPSPDAI
ncbi:Hypothetical protein NTJ_06093 [Nesidiocoris tenuis]|uniref:Uncharacterized protein n=1 Tax=Nesidiocoris tenuis TaxID=355587 RepID=A0ABN7APT1_9HEMI|nr:Hypothetical protein NTJ_06093 [Nesidiocoris tenuis]